MEEYNENKERSRGPGPFIPEQLHKYVTANTIPKFLQLPKSLGNKFHLCYMDPASDYFFISNGLPNPPREENWLINFLRERQAGLYIVGIID